MPAGSMNDPQPLEVYLNDHLAGATGACELARTATEKFVATPHRSFLSDFLAQVEQDRATLADMIDRLGFTQSPIKQAGAWLMEKVSRVKLSPAASGSEELSALLTLETLAIGVEGKICLWEALIAVAEADSRLAAFDLKGLLKRANDQRAGLERERIAAAKEALATSSAGVSG